MNTPGTISSSSVEFYMKDVVFAKAGGHKFWPSQIEDIEKAGKHIKYKKSNFLQPMI